MSNQVYKITTNLWRYYKGGFVVLILLVLLPGITSAQISYGVTFGTSQNDGAPCVGKGVCKESSSVADPSTFMYADNPEAVTATFQISPDNPNVLMMSFLLSELTAKQPGQVANFTSAAGTYVFDVTYSLINSKIYSLGGIPANAVISPSSNSVIVITGEIVTDYITLSTN